MLHFLVSFLKRAQILAADVNGCLRTDGTDYFTDIDTLTMFADYRVPQSLYFLGALTYDERLLAALKQTSSYEHIGDGNVSNEMECEIRGCSIYACDVRHRHLIKTKSVVCKVIINNLSVNC